MLAHEVAAARVVAVLQVAVAVVKASAGAVAAGWLPQSPRGLLTTTTLPLVVTM